jgi:hypothetical protein
MNPETLDDVTIENAPTDEELAGVRGGQSYWEKQHRESMKQNGQENSYWAKQHFPPQGNNSEEKK